jgi:hypothetical protein
MGDSLAHLGSMIFLSLSYIVPAAASWSPCREVVQSPPYRRARLANGAAVGTIVPCAGLTRCASDSHQSALTCSCAKPWLRSGPLSPAVSRRHRSQRQASGFSSLHRSKNSLLSMEALVCATSFSRNFLAVFGDGVRLTSPLTLYCSAPSSAPHNFRVASRQAHKGCFISLDLY